MRRPADASPAAAVEAALLELGKVESALVEFGAGLAMLDAACPDEAPPLGPVPIGWWSIHQRRDLAAAQAAFETAWDHLTGLRARLA